MIQMRKNNKISVKHNIYSQSVVWDACSRLINISIIRPFIQDTQQGNVVICPYEHNCIVFSVSSHYLTIYIFLTLITVPNFNINVYLMITILL